MPEKHIHQSAALDTDEVRIWHGGSGTLFAAAACVLQVRPAQSVEYPSTTAFHNTDITIGADGGVRTFVLGADFEIRLTAPGFVSDIGDGRRLRS